MMCAHTQQQPAAATASISSQHQQQPCISEPLDSIGRAAAATHDMTDRQHRLDAKAECRRLRLRAGLAWIVDAPSPTMLLGTRSEVQSDI